MPSFHPKALAKTKWWEYLVRFAFGGAVTVATGLITNAYGPSVGGLFLAFPAILPASLTLLKEHDGREQAAQAAAGSRLGAAGLIAFAAVTLLLSTRTGALPTLAAASALWAVVSFSLWQAVYGARAPRRPRSAGYVRRAKAAATGRPGSGRSNRPAT